MPTDENYPAPARPSDLTPSFGSNVRSSADILAFTGNSSQSGKRWHNWLDLPEHDNLRPRKLFFEDSTRRPEVAADL